MVADTHETEAFNPERESPRRRRIEVIIWLAFIAALIITGFRMNSLAMLNTLGTVFMAAALAQAWNILGGYGGYLNLGMAAFFGVGAYTAAILSYQLGWHPFYTAPLAGLAAVVLAVVFGIPSLRIRGVYFAIITLILTFLMLRLAFTFGITRGALGIFIAPLPYSARAVEQIFYFIFLGIALVVAIAVRLIEKSRFGYALVAIREDESAAELLGVRTTQTKMTALAIGAFVAGIVGAIFMQRVTFIDPDAAFPLTISVDPVIMAMYGGAGTWLGPLIGAPLVVMLGDFLRTQFGGLGMFARTGAPAEMARLVFGIILILVAMFARTGIVGLVRKLRKSRTPSSVYDRDDD